MFAKALNVASMQMVLLLGLVAVSLANPLTIEQLVSQPVPEEARKLTGKELVDYVNKKQRFFQVEYSELPPEMEERRVMDLKYLVIPDEKVRVQAVEYEGEIPESYDARERYPECPSLTYVRDQSNCGSCWAVSGVSAFSDRACIQSKGKIKTTFSDADVLSCCGFLCGEGCNGGYPYESWRYIVHKGVCTGGPYKAKGVCMPYPFHPCGYHPRHPFYGFCPFQYSTPNCERTCQAGYPKPFHLDRIYGKTVYRVPNSEKAIQKEILINGPVQAAFTVYDDFHQYKSGIYIHTAGRVRGGHAVKIIGWGVENGTKYWLIANSWNTYWGEEGYFRMVRGVNNCEIEEKVVAGTVDLERK